MGSRHDDYASSMQQHNPPATPLTGSLHFKRPARKSAANLRQQASKSSIRTTLAADDDDSEMGDSTFDATASSFQRRSSSPPQGNGSSGEPNGDKGAPTMDATTASLTKLLDGASKGKFAVGNLGRVLIEQEEQLRLLLEQLQDVQRAENGQEQESVQAAIKDTQRQIVTMKQEQQNLLRELLESSNIQLDGVHSQTSVQGDSDVLGSLPGTAPDHLMESLSSPSKPSNARELRRQKNAAAPNLAKDELLVNEIQQQLINEVRRLQALIAERDKALATMAEAAEESARIKTAHAVALKRLETEKDAQDANLYDLERKEELLREENEDMSKQLKKSENELRTLKRQFAEKVDAVETFKVGNEELEQRVEELRGSIATLKAKGFAEQKTITSLKQQLSEAETKLNEAVDKIPASASVASRLSSSLHGSSSMDATQMPLAMIGESPSGHRQGGAHDKALSPTASVDDDLASRLRPNPLVKDMELEVAKWRAAALKYRKKWSESRRQDTGEGFKHDTDDSTDEDEEILDAAWQDENAAPGKAGSKRGLGHRSSRAVSNSSRRAGKTMGDAFGIVNRMVSGGTSDKRASWQSYDLPESDRSMQRDDDEESSIAASSTRGSIDGYDPNFADPTIRGGSGKAQISRSRSTYTPSQMAKSSPLTRQLHLAADDSRSEADESAMSHNTHAGSSIHEAGALGDELNAVQQHDDEEDVRQLHAAALREAEEETAALQRELQERLTAHSNEVQSLHRDHESAIGKRDAVHAEQLAQVQQEHSSALAEHTKSHAQTMETAMQRHAQALESRGKEYDAQAAELQAQHDSKLKEITGRHTKVHDEAMAEARQRHTEALAKQRDEAQGALAAMQREHKALLEERLRTFEEQSKRKEAQYERERMHREKEHQGVLEDLHATHEKFTLQRDAVFQKHISERDEMIKSKEAELASMQARLDTLERDLAELRAQLSQSDAKKQEMSAEIEQLNKSLSAASASREDANVGSETRLSLEEFEDAPEESAAVVAVSGPPAKQDNAIQTEVDSSKTDGAVGQAARQRSSGIVPETSLAEESAASKATTLPPLPSMPPPPSLSTALARVQNARKDGAPGRPTTSPPAELVSRSQFAIPQITTTASSTGHSADATPRPSSRLANGPPPSAYNQTGTQRRSTTPSLSLLRTRTISQDGARRGDAADRASISSRTQMHPMRAPSAQSFASDATSEIASGRTSQASYYRDGMRSGSALHGRASANEMEKISTDPAVLGSITKTMIGEYLWKYTRRTMGRANKRHRRYFWIHPYTRTLYWTVQAPSEANSTEVVNKSAFIQDVMVVEDDNDSPANLYHLSIVITTSTRDVKMTASSREQHELWITALGYLVNRELPSESRQTPSEWRQSITKASLPRMRRGTTGPSTTRTRAITSAASALTPSETSSTIIDHARHARASSAMAGEANLDSERTPRARGASVGGHQSSLLHRRDTAAKEYLEHWETNQPKFNAQSFDQYTPRAGATSSMSLRSAGRGSLANDMFGTGSAFGRRSEGSALKNDDGDAQRYMSAEQMLAEDEQKNGYDGLDNVRACCDGKHDVGSLAHKHHVQQQQAQQQQQDRAARRGSMLSLRARTSTQSFVQRVASRAGKASTTTTNSNRDSVLATSRPTSPVDGLPQLGPININSLDIPAAMGAPNVPDATKPLTHDSSDWHSASEFGSLSGRATPNSDAGNSTTVGKSKEPLTASAAASAGPDRSTAGSRASSYVDRISQIRRNRASTSIR